MSIKDLDPNTPADTELVADAPQEFQAIKQALLAVFPELDGQITNTGATGDPGDTDPPDAATFSKLFEDVRQLTAGAGTGLIPVGGIVMWAGLTTNIPTGYALCDGGTYNAQVTPDLRDRFVVGAGDTNAGAKFAPGDAGGDDWDADNPHMTTQNSGDVDATVSVEIPDHTITVDNMPEHEHFTLANESGQDPGQTSTVSASNQAASYTGISDDRRYVMSGVSTEANTGRTSKYGVPTPQPLTHGDDPIEVTVENLEHGHDYAPKFLALAYIMYVGVPA
jgi:hypothetical protein